MNPLDVTALDQSTLNLSLNMTTSGKKPGSTEGTPLPVMLQPTTNVTVSPFRTFLSHFNSQIRFLILEMPTITPPPRPMSRS